MTLEKWRGREDLQLRWSDTWALPHMAEGYQLVVTMGLPQGTQVADINLNALKNAYNEGYFHALRNLRALGNIKQVSKEAMPEPWVKKQQGDS